MLKTISFLKQKTNHVIVIVLVIVGFFLYANTLNNELFWDDDQFILQNQYVRDFNFPKFFSENVIAGASQMSDYWRPVLLTVFSFQWKIWPGSEFGFHFTNLAFHIADAILLFFILQKLFKRRWLSFFTSLIFLAHPLQTEAVSYANSLGDSLSVFFMFLGLIFFLQKKHWLYPLAMFALALMSKETAIIFPGLVLLIELYKYHFEREAREIAPKRDLSLIARDGLQILKPLSPYIGLALIYIILRATALNFADSFNLYHGENVFTSSIFVRIFTFFRILTVYFSLFFWPNVLHMERSVEVAKFLFQTDVVLGGLIFVLILTIAFLGRKKYPVMAFGFLWFLFALAPTSNILVPINGLLYEHWLYVPLIGIALVIFELGSSLVKRFPMLIKLAIAIIIVIVVSLSSRTIIRNTDWQDSIRFYTQTLAYAPGSYRVINNLGMEYSERGMQDQAKVIYYKAIALDDRNPVAYH
ncbi:MAG: hypothetical protein HY336_00325, partial [Candidatus Doudnabacteria bacterium]|nr:hypothetical protein [Candidatus Doudnabacteria bacterium]